MSITQWDIPKSFDGAMMPIAFVPDWKKADYIDQRYSLDYGQVNQFDLLPIPKYENLKNDFNSLFTYITVFKGRYMDEDRLHNTGSHNWVDIRAPIGTPIFAIGHGKVVKVKNENNNKYITIEHRNVKYNGRIGKYYSSYLHLSETLVQLGDKIDRWTLIGRVWLTWYTTTPHLHLQVDNEDAPFYPFWPFTLTEAAESGYSFFEWVDAWLNQELIDRYSVDPIDFIKNATGIEWNFETIWSENEIQNKEEILENNTSTQINNSVKDVPINHRYYNSIKYFLDKGILKWYADNTIKVENNITRSEVLWIVLKALDIDSHGEIVTGIFRDVPQEHWVNPLITEAVKRKIVSTDRPFFEPNRPISRVEFLAILALAWNENIVPGIKKSWSDLTWSHWSHKYAQFGLENKLFDDIDGYTFKPNQNITRGELAEAVYRYLTTKNRLK